VANVKENGVEEARVRARPDSSRRRFRKKRRRRRSTTAVTIVLQ